MKWLKRLAIVLGLLLAVAIVVPFFIPVSSYIPHIEQLASKKLNEPVKIESLSLSAVPLPHATLKGISVGKAPLIKIQSVSVTPDLFSLLGAVKIVKSLDLEGVTVKQDTFAKIPAWTKTDGSPAQVRIDRVRLRNGRVELKPQPVGPFDAEVEMRPDGGIEKGYVATSDGKMKITATPEKENYVLDASAKDWKVPAGPPLLINELNAKGLATPNELNINTLAVKLYGGSVNGTANLNWQKGWRLKGNLDTKQVELKNLAPVINPNVAVSGKLNAKTNISGRAAAAGQLANALRVESNFNVEKGVLYNVDIVQAAKSLIKSAPKGGKTEFDELSGVHVMDAAGHHFSQLKVTSGVLSAAGNVDISPKQELSGKLDAGLKAGSSVASVPLAVSGTVKDPVLSPTKGVLAGAAAGTAVLGPAGTAIGAKAGGALGKLFEKKEEKK